MNQDERRVYLLRALLAERPQGEGMAIPPSPEGQWRLLRSLLNIRPPRPVSEAFLQVQDAYLQEETARKGIADWADLAPVEEGIALWRGDITTLRIDGIVNAANSQLLGCFCPCHGCIDNAIHTYAGVQLRLACAELMARQGAEEPVGRAKITPGFNLPCQYVLHTVGPYVAGPLTEEHRRQLAACYRACLALADERGLRSLAFCCISTGEFHFPAERAAEIAVETVRAHRALSKRPLEVVFNVFTEKDFALYRQLLGRA
ncbi:protein-ADP-ribose hydrolase [Bittarella massiliensis (ex Durand et al. 2017)]|uniref:protein-ADP-ribose hydrolase n=1 Tax=Bittarella massiliensis (ex Durand et al. 2017) TaxID=1720313 RepID=UPI001AA12854|nr:protein-ADP-ribose hydrolase [Bittarella massiliensis (ex Durand et al. 2017)]MBO1679770.1 protein-ADP-ribose hydrolase [Bittarella massiliensis (ex Durand et al. 2017)]